MSSVNPAIEFGSSLHPKPIDCKLEYLKYLNPHQQTCSTIAPIALQVSCTIASVSDWLEIVSYYHYTHLLIAITMITNLSIFNFSRCSQYSLNCLEFWIH
uniref:Uncharacterized protein n=1 Tax=Cacopsylla melanoneura TaxID=428564 RepID=A0A8D8RK39_9HEMI